MRYAEYKLTLVRARWCFAWHYSLPNKSLVWVVNEINHLRSKKYRILNAIYGGKTIGDDDDVYLNVVSKYCLDI